MKIEWLIAESPDDARCMTLRQVHGALGQRRFAGEGRFRPEGDWQWTTDRGVSLGIFVADCTAVLIEGKRRSGEPFLAAIHAGWRGTRSHILKTWIDEVLPSDGWTAWLSPSICKNHFEVGEDVRRAFMPIFDRYAEDIGGYKYHFDLRRLQEDQIKSLGGNFYGDSRCTYCESNLISYRRDGPLLKKRHLAQISWA